MPATVERPSLPAQRPRPRLYYGWWMLLLAAWAMTCTLPGRTHGLGLIAGPLTADPALGVSEARFALLNFWAILLGSILCLPTGRAVDRFGARWALALVAAGLGAAVLAMSQARGPVALFAALTLVRGLGQGALSVVSMALVGKWFVRRLGAAMGIYTVLLSLGFIATTVALGLAVPEVGWRAAWQGMGACLIVGLALPAALVAHSTPESLGLAVEHDPAANQAEGASATLAVALRTPLFRVLALAASLFGLVWSAITLFNEAILAERGFDQRTFVLVMAILVFVGLPANLLTGWAAQRRGATPLVAVGMALLAAALAAFPWVTTLWQVLLYAAALGTAGGMVTVLFFTAFPQAFGRGHLGSIQAVVQVCTVLASALGPVVLTQTKRLSGSYTPFFLATGAAALLLGGIAWWTPRPGGRTRP